MHWADGTVVLIGSGLRGKEERSLITGLPYHLIHTKFREISFIECSEVPYRTLRPPQLCCNIIWYDTIRYNTIPSVSGGDVRTKLDVHGWYCNIPCYFMYDNGHTISIQSNPMSLSLEVPRTVYNNIWYGTIPLCKYFKQNQQSSFGCPSAQATYRTTPISVQYRTCQPAISLLHR